MGKRRPKSGTGGTDDSDSGPDDEYGRGEYDPATGLYEYYDRPRQAEGSPVTWEEILDQFPLIIADFASEYGIRLHRESLTWAEFRHLVYGLLQTQSRLWHATRPDDEHETPALTTEG